MLPCHLGAGAVWWLRGRQGRGKASAVLLLALEPEILERENGGYFAG
jgi:hypothetical protein